VFADSTKGIQEKHSKLEDKLLNLSRSLFETGCGPEAYLLFIPEHFPKATGS
jgi:hypothetical protein